MIKSFFVSDLHGSMHRYEVLYREILNQRPETVFIGGDILPSSLKSVQPGIFLKETLIKGFRSLKDKMKNDYPEIFIILGNDDGKLYEKDIIREENNGLWKYSHFRKIMYKNYKIFGYSYIPPTPFLLKDWEKYDLSRYTDPGCVSPEEGFRTYKTEANLIKFSTIKKDLDEMFNNEDLSKSVLLFHSPPYNTSLDILSDTIKYFDSAPLDNHAGSIAIRDIIEEKQPLVTLHGHIHETVRFSGEWKDTIGNTLMISGAHEGSELSLVIFDIENPISCGRLIL